jgi:Protein of unknown function (DUF4038)/Putative collagen-binding domain of a collagenase
MSKARQKSWLKLVLILLASALILAATLGGFHHSRSPAGTRAIQFQIPVSDRVSRDSSNSGNSTIVPGDQLMTLDPTRKFLINSATKKPVFITGDSAWSLQGRLSDFDIQFYLNDRASRGFNAIWVALADNTYSNHAPADFCGNVPFNGADFTSENPQYWARVDQTLSWAAARGITVLADPAFVGYGCKGGYCESYRNSSIDVVAAYGQFLGKRYKGFRNIMWLIGGDADPADGNVQSKLYALAKGIKSADTVHLMTTENYRGTSSIDVWSGSPWLDLDALYLQPSDIPAKANADYTVRTYPVFMMEDWYEGEHSITELGVRQEGYWAVLSGSTLGRLFGNDAVWNFSLSKLTSESWKTELGATGTVGQAWLGKLFRSREHWKLEPDIHHAIMIGGYDSRGFLTSTWESARSLVYQLPYHLGSASSVAARTSDGQTIIAYVPNGNAATITIDMSQITDPESQAKCWWFNPRDGSDTLIGIYSTVGSRKFTPPDPNDWVLVIDSLSANLTAPGSADL